MNGRFFAGQKVEAYVSDGSEKFKKHNPKNTDEDEAARLEKFGSWLEDDKA
jgi:HIV Tat-specific factor 1